MQTQELVIKNLLEAIKMLETHADTEQKITHSTRTEKCWTTALTALKDAHAGKSALQKRISTLGR